MSQHTREVMALPDWAVSYLPAVIETGSRRAYAHDYALMYRSATARHCGRWAFATGHLCAAARQGQR